MQITRSTADTQKGLRTWFTGDVYIDAVATPAGTSTVAAANVHFTPGARTACAEFAAEDRDRDPQAGDAQCGTPPIAKADRSPTLGCIGNPL